MDIIYKEQALELISDRNIEAHMDSVMDGELHRVKRAVQRIIVSMPSAEKTGKWIRITQGAVPEMYICPFCHRTIKDYDSECFVSIRYPYCHCGARMVNEDEKSV